MPFDIAALGQQTASAGIGTIMGLALEKHNDQRQINQESKLQNLQLQGSKALTDYQFQKQLEMWKATNYSAQMEQLQKAGLNPGLLYGMSGGGATTTGGDAAKTDTGRAQQNPGEVQQLTAMGMQLGMNQAQTELLKAQKQNVDADTANKKAENPNIPLQGENIKAQTGKLIADTGNINMDTGLKAVQKEILDIDKIVKYGTIEDQIRIINGTANKIGEEVESLGYRNNVDKATVDTKIDQAKWDLINTYLDSKLISQQTGKTEQEKNLLIQQNHKFLDTLASTMGLQSRLGIAAMSQAGSSESQANTASMKQQWDQLQNDVPDSEKLPFEAVERILQAIILKGALTQPPVRNPVGYK